MDKREELADVTLSFAEVLVHALLYVRGLYPQDVFDRRKEYGVPVWMSRHPGLNHAIFTALASMKSALLAGAVEGIIFTVLDPTGRPCEAYHLDVDLGCAEDVPATYSDLDSMLAAAVTRVMALEHTLPPLTRPAAGAAAGLPPGAPPPPGTPLTCDYTWTLLLATHESATGPRVAYAAGAGAGGAGADGGSSSSSSSSSAPSADDLLLGPGSKWARVDPGDPAAQLAVTALPPAASGDGVGSGSGSATAVPAKGTLLKSVRAGRLGLQLRLVRPDYAAAGAAAHGGSAAGAVR